MGGGGENGGSGRFTLQAEGAGRDHGDRVPGAGADQARGWGGGGWVVKHTDADASARSHEPDEPQYVGHKEIASTSKRDEKRGCIRPPIYDLLFSASQTCVG